LRLLSNATENLKWIPQACLLARQILAISSVKLGALTELHLTVTDGDSVALACCMAVLRVVWQRVVGQ